MRRCKPAWLNLAAKACGHSLAPAALLEPTCTYVQLSTLFCCASSGWAAVPSSSRSELPVHPWHGTAWHSLRCLHTQQALSGQQPPLPLPLQQQQEQQEQQLQAPVLISGAGPSGLTLALLLSRYGERARCTSNQMPVGQVAVCPCPCLHQGVGALTLSRISPCLSVSDVLLAA